MYPVSLGFQEAERRIKSLIDNGHHAEALVTSVFSFEKTLRRALRFCALARGFTSKHAAILFANMGFKSLKEIWPCFEPQHRSLPEFIGNAKWQHVQQAVTMRNKLAHGDRVYNLEDCRITAERILEALNEFRTKLSAEVQYDGWSRLPVRRKSTLQWSPPIASELRRTA